MTPVCDGADVRPPRLLRAFAVGATLAGLAATVAVAGVDARSLGDALRRGLASPLLLCLTTLAVSGLGSVLPFSPVEPLLVGLAAVAPPHLLLPIALLATASHMAGKAVVYLASRDARALLPARQREGVERLRARLARGRVFQHVTLLASAVTGVPSFYAVTVACGVLRVSLPSFLVLGTLGRGARFVGLVMAPRLVGALA